MTVQALNFPFLGCLLYALYHTERLSNLNHDVHVWRPGWVVYTTSTAARLVLARLCVKKSVQVVYDTYTDSGDRQEVPRKVYATNIHTKSTRIQRSLTSEMEGRAVHE